MKIGHVFLILDQTVVNLILFSFYLSLTYYSIVKAFTPPSTTIGIFSYFQPVLLLDKINDIVNEMGL